MKNKSIVLVIPSLKVGGMERVMSELANYFVNINGPEVHLIILGKQDKFYKIDSRIKIWEPSFIFDNEKRLYNTYKTIKFLRSSLKKIKPISVLSFGETYNSFVLLASIGLKSKVVISDRSKPDKDWGFFQNILRKYIYRRSYGIISQTEYAANFIRNLTKHKNIHVIPNPTYSLNFSLQLKENIMLTVGRLIDSKNVDDLIIMFSEIKFDDWKLWIVGDGPEKQKLEKLTIDLDLIEDVIFWGSRKDVGKFYNQASIFAFTSISEGFPNALLEAMTAGLPIIAYDCIAGPSDLIEDGKNGFLIPMLDSDLYKKKLKKLLSDSALRGEFGERAFSTSKEYDMNVIGKKYLNILTS
jgi:glycosyltransferase involved in cell wall biosynthesis